MRGLDDIMPLLRSRGRDVLCECTTSTGGYFFAINPFVSSHHGKGDHRVLNTRPPSCSIWTADEGHGGVELQASHVWTLTHRTRF